MTPAGDWSERVQRHFRRPPAGAAAAGPCPASDEVRLAAEGDLASAAQERLVDHAAACPACTLVWRLVRADGELLAETAGGRPADEPVRAGWGRRLWPVAALIMAAALVAGLAARRGLWPSPGPAPGPGAVAIWRGDGDGIRSLVDDGTTMERDAVVLRWTAAPDGSRYRVVVTDESLEPLWTAEALQETEATVPEAALEGLPAGSRLLWSVEAVLPDGRRLASPAYVLILR